MVEYKSMVTISRPPETVFEYLEDPAKQALWSDVPMRNVSGGSMRPGLRMEVTFGKGPLKATVGLEVKGFEPGRRLAFDSYSGPIRWTHEYRLAPSGTGTELSQEGRMQFTGLWRLIEPLVGGEISGGEVKEMERLKAVVESA